MGSNDWWPRRSRMVGEPCGLAMTLGERVLRLATHWRGRHRYLSTGCLHGLHAHCDSDTTAQGRPKTARTCKHCPTRCVCHCHRGSIAEATCASCGNLLLYNLSGPLGGGVLRHDDPAMDAECEDPWPVTDVPR